MCGGQSVGRVNNKAALSYIGTRFGHIVIWQEGTLNVSYEARGLHYPHDLTAPLFVSSIVVLFFTNASDTTCYRSS